MAKDSSRWWKIQQEDIPLAEYTNIFLANSVWILRGIDKNIATYDLVVREIPKNWGFYIFDGLERFVDILLSYKFDSDALVLLEKMTFSDTQKTREFYKNFKFSGNVFALPDGTIFFPGEPIVRIIAPLCEANLITAFMLNVFSYPIRVLTKSARYKLAVGDTLFFGGGLVRLGAFEHTIQATRAGVLLGSSTFSPIWFRKNPDVIPEKRGTVNLNHALIKSFNSEREAYRYALDNLFERSDHMAVMVDTYDFKKGLKIFIEEVKKTPNYHSKNFNIEPDSGNISELSRYARRELDKNGLFNVRIWVASNLDEYKVEKMRRQNLPIDSYVSMTEMTNITDNPKLEAVYKMAELRKDDGKIEYKAKFAKGKESFPGRKQVFRIYEEGKMKKDVIGLEDEKLRRPLLKEIIKDGKLVYKFPKLSEIRKNINDEIESLPEKYKKITNPSKYPVVISNKLKRLTGQVRKIHC